MITGSISLSDYVEAQNLHRRSFRRKARIASFMICIVGLIALFVDRQLGQVLFFGGIGLILGEWMVSRYVFPRTYQRLYRQTKAFAEAFTYTWDTECIQAEGSGGYSKRPWSNYCKLKENEHVFLLYHSDNLFEVLPKSWFANPSLVSEFRDLAVRSIP